MKQQDGRQPPRVCFFGIYDPAYPRNRVLVRGFEENGYEVKHCSVSPRNHKGFFKFFALVREYMYLRDRKFDLVIVAFPGHTILWLARLLFGGCIIFDAFVSLYGSNVEDRKLYAGKSIRGVRDWLLDWYSLKFSPIILLDTDAQIKYVSKKFHVPVQKFRRVFVGTDDLVFRPRDHRKEDGRFIVHFHGTFIPLHGVRYIVEAAKLLESHKDIFFEIIGSGQEKENIDTFVKRLGGVKNIRWLSWLSYDDLAGSISASDICLGIFGITDKASVVIPNKVFEAMASKRACITMNSVAMEELVTDGETMVLCPSGDSQGLAEKILFLRENRAIMDQIAENAYELFTKECTPSILVKRLLATV